jgi:hypothetical protein
MQVNRTLSDRLQESPHEHQQSQLLSRIITNVVCDLTKEDCHRRKSDIDIGS